MLARSLDGHFTRHSDFLSLSLSVPPLLLHLEYICRPFLFAPRQRGPSVVRSTPDMICHISTPSICCHITAAENYQENSGGHRRQRLLAHPRSPQPISFNRSKEGKEERKGRGKAYHEAANKIWRDCRVMPSSLPACLLSLTFKSVSQTASRLSFQWTESRLARL